MTEVKDPENTLVIEVDEGLRAAALEHLRGSTLVVEPRKQWPSNLGEGGPKGRIAEDERVEPGRALSVIGDGGWGRLVRDGRHEREHFDDELVGVAAELIRERWQPDPMPAWVTSPANDCSQTRSGTHIPRTGTPNSFSRYRENAVICPTRSRRGMPARIGS